MNTLKKPKVYKAHACSLCWKVFMQKTLRNSHCLKQHRVSHDEFLISKGVAREDFNNLIYDIDKEKLLIISNKSHGDGNQEKIYLSEFVQCMYSGCEEMFNKHDETSLSDHILHAHIKCVFTCDSCNKLFSSEDKLLHHQSECVNLQSHHDLSIDITMQSILSDSLAEYDTPLTQYSCPVCNRKLKTEKGLQSHIRSHNNLQCNLCGKHVSDRSILKRHMLTHESVKPFKCQSHCDKTFATKSQLEYHMLSIKGIYNFMCSICSLMFKSNSNLQSHMVRHRGEKPFQCNICGSTFARNSELKRHSYTHSGEKSYACSICEKAFSVQSLLTKHLDVHKPSSQRIRYPCPHCQKSFSRSQHVPRHIRTVHSNLNTQAMITSNEFISVESQTY